MVTTGIQKMIILLLISHFIGDFALQSRKIATTKSTKLTSLSIHLGILFLSLLPITFLMKASFYIPILYCILHGIQDWFIWKGYKQFYTFRQSYGRLPPPFQEDHWFYFTIGFDQLLHIIILLFLFK